MIENIYKEAFCLMIYECEKCKSMEVIWNSRDGVTPFSVLCRNCDSMSQHNHWSLDKYVPNYKPFNGQRVFIDLTEKAYRIYMEKRIETFWNNSEYPMKDMFKNKEDALKELMKDFDDSKGSPDIIIFND